MRFIKNAFNNTLQYALKHLRQLGLGLRQLALHRILLLGVVASLLAGCGQSGLGPTPQPLPSAEPAPPGELRLYLPNDGSAPDPLVPKSRQMQQAMSLVFDNFIDFTDDGRLVENLALTWQDSTQNGETCWTFTLREDIEFHGTSNKVTAHDVVFTMDQIMANANSPYRSALTAATRYEATGDYTLRVYCAKPMRTFLRAMVFPVVSEHAYGQTELPIGSGPFRVTANDDQAMVMIKNQKWWRQLPDIETVTLRYFKDEPAALAAFSNRQIDMLSTLNRTAASYQNYGRSQVISCVTQTYQCLLPNFNNSVLAQSAVRRAIATALDKDTLSARAYCNFLLPSDTPLTPDDWLYNPALEQISYDLKLAKQLLEDAGWRWSDDHQCLIKSGMELKFELAVYDSLQYPEHLEAAHEIARQLGLIGCRVTVNPLTMAEYDEIITKDKSVDCLYTGITFSRMPDWDFLLNTMGSSNIMHTSFSALDGALSRYKEAATEEDCKLAMQDICTQIRENLPLIGIGFRQEAVLANLRINKLEKPRSDMLMQSIRQWELGQDDVAQ